MENDTWVQENNGVRGQVSDSVAMWDNPVLTVWVPTTNEVLRVAADEVGLEKLVSVTKPLLV